MRSIALSLASVVVFTPAFAFAQNTEPYPNDPNANANANANAPKKVEVEGCGCEPKKKDENEDRWREKVGVSGLRASAWRVRGADEDHQGWGLQFAGNSTDVRTRDGVARMGKVFFALGGGEGGFEGAFGGLIAGGTRIDAADDQGLVLRLGLQGWLQGNSHFYSSHFELPVVQVGWQYARGLTMLEFGAQGGPVLVGRYNPDGATRKLGGDWEGTGYVAFHFPHMRFDATFTRYVGSSGPGTALDLARATTCLMARPIGVCADLSTWQGEVFLGSGAVREARTIYGGFLLGVSER